MRCRRLLLLLHAPLRGVREQLPPVCGRVVDLAQARRLIRQRWRGWACTGAAGCGAAGCGAVWGAARELVEELQDVPVACIGTREDVWKEDLSLSSLMSLCSLMPLHAHVARPKTAVRVPGADIDDRNPPKCASKLHRGHE